MKNIGQYNEDLSVPRKKDIDSLETRVKTNEDNIAMAESDIEGLNTGVSTLKTDVSNVKTALSSKQDTIVGAASTIVEDNLSASKVLVSDASGKVSVSDVTSTELSYLDGVTSNVQTQLNNKQGIEDEIQAVRLRGGINSIINNASAVSINPAVNAIGFLLHNGGNVQIFYDGYLMPFQNQEIDTLFDGKSSTYINFGDGPRNAKNEGVCRWSETTQYPQNARVMYQTTSGVFRWYKALKESQGVIPEGDSTGAWEDVSISSSPNKMDVRNLDISIVIDSPSTFKYENGISLYWRALNQNCGYYKIEVYDSVQNQYALVAERDNIPEDEVVNTQYLGTKVNGNGKRARITLRSQPRQAGGWFAATQIALTGIDGGIEGTLVNRGGSTMYGNLSPYIDGGASLGTSSAQWEQVRAQNIYGNVNNTTSTFSQASSRTNISSGDKLSTIFGKIAKWFSDLGSLAFKSSVAKSDLANDVQTSLDKADSALQSAPVISVNSKTGAVTLGAVDIGALPLTGGTLSGNLNLNTNKLCLNEDGYQVSAPMGHLQIKKDTDLTPNSVAITEYNDNENKQLHFVVNDSSDGSHNTQVVLKKNTLQLYNNTVSGSSISMGYVNVKGVADAINDHDAVNLRQLNSSLGNYVSKVGTNGQTIASSFEAANSIKVQTGGEVNNTIELLSSDVAPSLVATSSGKSMSVSFVPQYSEVSFNTDDNVTLTGIKAGTNDTDAVNVGQLNATIAAAGGLKASDILFVYVAINRLVGSVAPFGNGLYLHTITSYRSLTITVKDGPTVATNELQAIVPLFSSGSISARDISIRFFDNYITSIDYLASVSDIPESLTIWCYAVKK